MLTKRIIRFAIAAVVITLLLSANLSNASVSRAQDKKIRIAYLTKHLDNPWFVNETNGAKALAQKLGDVDLTIQDLQFDANLALSAMDTVIGAGTSGILIVVPEQKIGPAVMEKAATAKIPLMTVDDTIQDKNGVFAPHVGFDTAEMGKAVANKANEFFAQDGWDKVDAAKIRIISIEDQTLSVCMQRTDSANATWKALRPNFPDKNIIHLPYANTLVSAVDAVAPVVTANPDVTNWILWSCNDDGVMGAVRALEQGGVKAENIIGVGLNGHLACDEWLKDKPTGFRATIYNRSASHGEFALMAMYMNVKYGVPLPTRIVAPGVPVTKENMKMMDFPSCAK
ncbi:MAG: substrate-binding domain-containing protein [Anaerolineae bacterium]|nr:substrate-binding domain-containing protein [Anaerolineae bacterium]